MMEQRNFERPGSVGPTDGRTDAGTGRRPQMDVLAVIKRRVGRPTIGHVHAIVSLAGGELHAAEI